MPKSPRDWAVDTAVKKNPQQNGLAPDRDLIVLLAQNLDFMSLNAAIVLRHKV
jgi:hypothetical protein